MTSLIVSFYERIGHLKCCLDALAMNAEDFDEVIIADDGSSEEVVDKIHLLTPEYNFRIKHVWQPPNGFQLSANRNNGIRNAEGDYLIFLDCDFLVLPGTIKSHTSVAKPGMFVAGLCKYLSEDTAKQVFERGVSGELLQNLYSQLPDKPIRRDHRRFLKYKFLCMLGLANPRKQRCSSHFSIHRKDIEKINGYDENFRGWGGEDEDITFRMVQAGLRGKSIIPQARVLHLWHSKELGDKHWKEGTNVEYLNRKVVPHFCENGLVKR